MRNETKHGGVCIALAVVVLSSGCTSEKKGSATSDFHEGDALSSYSQEITSPIHEFEVKVGETYTLNITAKNTGTQPWFGQGASPVNACYRWLDPKGVILPIEGKRTSLSSAVLQPGATDQLKLQVVAPANPGSYTLWVSMVQEGVDWFFGKGAKPLVIQVTVD
jgi:hypothetical protein